MALNYPQQEFGTSIGVPIARCSSFVASVATLITKEYFWELKLRLEKLKDWINMITILYDNTIKNSTIVKKIEAKDGEKLKENFNHYLDKD